MPRKASAKKAPAKKAPAKKRAGEPKKPKNQKAVNLDESYAKHLKKETVRTLKAMIMYITGAKLKDLKGVKKDQLVKEIMKRTQLHVIKRTAYGGNWWDSFKEGFELPFKAAAHVLPFVL